MGPGGWFGSWLLARGERAVVLAGLGILALVVTMTLAAGAWAVWTDHQAQDRAAKARLHSLASGSGKALAMLLTMDKREDAQRLLRSLTTSHGLTHAVLVAGDERRTVLGDGTDASFRPPARLPPPERWRAEVTVEPQRTSLRTDEDRVWIVAQPLEVPGFGTAALELGAALPPAQRASAELRWGMIAMGTLGMVLGLAFYRTLRWKMRALGAIQEALRYAWAFDKGELPTSGLRLADALGDEARAWNKLLEERDALRQRASLDDAAKRLAGLGGAGGDFAAAFDALWLGVLIVDEAGKVRVINGAACVLLRCQRQEAIDQPAMSIIRFPQAQELVTNATAGKNRQRGSVELTQESETPGGETSQLRFTVRPMRREDGAAAMVVIEDVTQQRVADESRHTFVTQVSHELRNPLTTIRLYLEQLVDEGDKDPLVKARCLNVLARETRRLERIVGDLLSVSQMDAGEFKLVHDDVPLPALFEELNDDFRAQAQDKEIELVFDMPPKLPLMTGDRDKLVLAVYNLINNAIKYTPQGGRVVVSAREDEGGLVVAVADTGIGIREDELERVFDKFYRAKDRRIASITGSGIGLALARQVVRMHGGDITVQSQIDKGSTFSIRLPIRTPGARAAA